MDVMNTKPAKILSLSVGMLLGALLWVNLSSEPLGVPPRLAPPNLSINPEPISREMKLATSFASVVKAVSPSVVYITSTKTIERPTTSDLFGRSPFFPFMDPRRRPDSQTLPEIGSGVIISDNGFILTNNHVVEDAENIVVMLKDRKTEFQAVVVGADPHTDIAVIKVDSPEPLPAVTLTDSDTLEVGDLVLAVGNPFNVGQTVTMGLVSGIGRSDTELVDVANFIQTDAAINPGNSGGPLVDAEGRVVGINTAIMSRSGGNQGIGFAVPINMAREVMDQIVEFGDVQRGLLGVTMQEMTDALANQFDIEVGQGVLVSEVTARGPADRAGVRAGDVILSFDGEAVSSMKALKLLVSGTRPDTVVDVELLRRGKLKTVSVSVGKIPEGGYRATQRYEEPTDDAIEHDALDGVTVTDLDSRTRSEMGVPRSVRGVLVTRVERGCPSDVAGIQPGDLILSIEGQPVSNADEAVELSEAIQRDEVLIRYWRRGQGSRFQVVDAKKDRR